MVGCEPDDRHGRGDADPLGQHDAARAGLRASLADVSNGGAHVAQTRTRPLQAPIYAMWSQGRPDPNLASQIDDMSGADRRSVARDLIAKGHILPERTADDNGDMCSPRRRAPRVVQTERGGIAVDVIQHEGFDHDLSGAMPIPRQHQRVTIGAGHNHPRFPQEPTGKPE